MRAMLLSLLAIVLMLAPVSFGQGADFSPSIRQDTLTPPARLAGRVSASPVQQASDILAYVPQLRPTGNITMYLPLVMNNYCPPFTISDPYFSYYQYDMRQINADAAWLQCAQGDPGIVVAVIDTGVNLSHPDLAPNLIPGASFVSDEPSVEDGNGHGSNVAGIAGAALNGIGVVGVAPKTHLLPVKVLDSTGSGDTSWVASGVTFAADRANVLNLSLGGIYDSSTLRDAINYAADTQGRLVVAAAGNCGDPTTYKYNGCTFVNQPVYPGAYSNVMAVAAVDSTDSWASFSNQGDYVDVAAPGVDIYNTYKDGGYAYETGTSQATPHVAGLAALIWARYPTYTAAQVRALIENTAVDLGAWGWDQQFGYGRIDASAALGLTYNSVTHSGQARPARVELPAPVDHREADIAPGRVLVKFQPSLSTASLHQTLGAFSSVSIESQIEALNVEVLRVPVGQEWSLVDQLRALPGVEYAEPDYAVRLIQ
jgi:subtilisin family serine protease